MVNLFFVLLVGHALVDYGLQSAYMASTKSSRSANYSFWSLFAHSTMHGGAVYFITGSIILGLVEMLLHFIIDKASSNGEMSRNVDQLLHILCKMVYIIVLVVIYG